MALLGPDLRSMLEFSGVVSTHCHRCHLGWSEGKAGDVPARVSAGQVIEQHLTRTGLFQLVIVGETDQDRLDLSGVAGRSQRVS